MDPVRSGMVARTIVNLVNVIRRPEVEKSVRREIRDV